MKLPKNNNTLILTGGIIILIIIFIYIYNKKNTEKFITIADYNKNIKKKSKHYNFSRSCTQPNLNGRFLQAKCNTAEGKPWLNNKRLNIEKCKKQIENCNGVLTCDTCDCKSENTPFQVQGLSHGIKCVTEQQLYDGPTSISIGNL